MKSKVPKAAQSIDKFMRAIEVQLGKSANHNAMELQKDWATIKEFVDAVFLPPKSFGAKRGEMELDTEAQEEVDFLFYELIQAGILPQDTTVKDK